MAITRAIIDQINYKCKNNSWQSYQYFKYLKDQKISIDELFKSLADGDTKIEKLSCPLVVMHKKQIFEDSNDLEKVFNSIHIDRKVSKEDNTRWRNLKTTLKKIESSGGGYKSDSDYKETFRWEDRFKYKPYKDVDLFSDSPNIPNIPKALKVIFSPKSSSEVEGEDKEEEMSTSNDNYLKASKDLKLIYDADIILKEAIFGELGRWIGHRTYDLYEGAKGIFDKKPPTISTSTPPKTIKNEDIKLLKEKLENVILALDSIPIIEPPQIPVATTTSTSQNTMIPTLDTAKKIRINLEKLIEALEKLYEEVSILHRNLESKDAAFNVYNLFDKVNMMLRRFISLSEKSIDKYIDQSVLPSGIGVFHFEFSKGITVNNAVKELNSIKDDILKKLEESGSTKTSSDGKFSKNEKKSHKNFEINTKTANYNSSCVPCQIQETNNMKKKADKFSNKYYRDAVSGLDDGAAKSYLAGLKGMYGKKPKKTKADYAKLYELHDETGPDLIGSAHPKTIDIAESMGNGGVVENQIEQQRHNIGVAQSMPSGNFQGKHAWVIHKLVKLAEHADRVGDIETSDLIDEALEELVRI